MIVNNTENVKFEFRPIEACIFVLECIIFCLIVYYGVYKRVIKPLNVLAISREKIKKKYFLMFERRDALMYHIGSCKERGDFKDARRMTIDLDQVDKVCLQVQELLVFRV